MDKIRGSECTVKMAGHVILCMNLGGERIEMDIFLMDGLIDGVREMDCG